MTIEVQDGYDPGDDPAGVPLIGYETAISSITASSEETGFPASNLLNPATHLIWKASADSPTDTILTIAVTEMVNYVAIAKHNFFESQATLSLGTGASPNLISGVQATDTLPMIFRISPQAGPLTLSILGGSEAAQAAVIYAGDLLVLERSVKADVGHRDIVHARQSAVLSGMSESGNFLGRVMTSEWRESQAEFAWFTPDWYRENFEPFVESAQTEPFFFAWNPDEYPDDTAYAWIIEDIQPETDPATRRIAATITMRAIA